MIIPKIKKFNSCSEYLKEFYEANKKNNKNFSFRLIAKKLKWPISYLPEVISSKKNLSIQRALEFAAYAKLNSNDTERLIYLSLHSSLTPELKTIIENQFLKMSSGEIFKSTISAEDHKIFLHLESLAIHQYLNYHSGKLDIKHLLNSLVTFPNLTEEKVQQIIELLLVKGIIKEVGKNQFVVIKQEIFFDQDAPGNEHNEEIHKRVLKVESEYANIYQRFLEKPFGSGCFFSGFLQIPNDKLEEANDKIFQLRDFLINLSNETLKMEKDKKKVYQFAAHLFPLIK